MKTYLVNAMILGALCFPSGRVQACCGDGQAPKKVPAAVEADCNKKALDLTLALATTQYPKSPEDRPQLPFKGNGTHVAEVKVGTASIYPQSVTMSASVLSENEWDCLYCVTFDVSDSGECIFRSLQLNHCAK